MSILSKLKTFMWYLARPKYYSEMIALVRQRLGGADRENTASQSQAWCAGIAVSTAEAYLQITGKEIGPSLINVYPDIFEGAKQREASCPVKMGGAGNLELAYYLSEYAEAVEVIETGVAYGWSSLALLLSLQHREGKLESVDMPYAKMGNDQFVGIVVPDKLRQRWNLIRLPDSKGLKIALKNTRQLDLCHYDSDKSYKGRLFAYPLLWEKLRPGGLFLSDDIQDNIAFHDFCKQIKKTPVVVSFGGKYIGIIKKGD